MNAHRRREFGLPRPAPLLVCADCILSVIVSHRKKKEPIERSGKDSAKYMPIAMPTEPTTSRLHQMSWIATDCKSSLQQCIAQHGVSTTVISESQIPADCDGGPQVRSGTTTAQL